MSSPVLKQCEVLDGSINFGWSANREHDTAVSSLWASVRRAAQFEAIQCLLRPDLRIEDDPLCQRKPDVLLARNAPHDEPVRPRNVVLAAEVVAPNSRVVDTIHKRAHYALVGVPHYWIVETRNGAKSTVTWYSLPADEKRYEVRACWTPAESPDGIRAEEPFPIRIAWDELAF